VIPSRRRSGFISEAMLADPVARQHMDEAAALSTKVEPVVYSVASVHQPWAPPRPAGLPRSVD
jgi:hypothetical protein